MKAKALTLFIGIVAFCASMISANAQTVDKKMDFSNFDSIQASNAFIVTLAESSTYSASWTVDQAIEEYVQIYVKGSVLYITLNEKAIPKETKALYKGKVVPTLKVTVKVPTITAITLTEDSSLDAAGFKINATQFELKASDNASVSNLSVKANKITLSADKKSSVGATVESETLNVTADNSANMTITHTSNSIALNGFGSSAMTVSGDCTKSLCQSRGTAKITVNGKAESLDAQGQGTSTINASNFPVKNATVNLNGSTLGGATLWVNASATLQLDLKGGSEVIYGGDPEIEILGIQKSSVTRFENAKK